MKAWQLLRTKKQWCQYSNAINKKSELVNPRHKTAVSWCAYGAIYKCYPLGFSRIEQQLEASIPYWSLEFWNDDPARKFSEVKAVLKKLDI